MVHANLPNLERRESLAGSEGPCHPRLVVVAALALQQANIVSVPLKQAGIPVPPLDHLRLSPTVVSYAHSDVLVTGYIPRVMSRLWLSH